MNLATGSMARRVKCEVIQMASVVVDRVQAMAARQGYKTLKFYNRKLQAMELTPIDQLMEELIDGPDDWGLIVESGGQIPQPIDLDWVQESDGEETNDEDEELDPLTNEEVAEVIEEADNPPDPVVNADEKSDSEDESESEDDGDAENCGDIPDDDVSVPPSLVSEPEERPRRMSRAPEHHDPSTGRSYVTKTKQVHNLVKQDRPDLTYGEIETKVVALLLNRMREECRMEVHLQQYNLRRGLKELGEEGVKARKEELGEMHSRVGFKAVAVAELTRQERI